MIHVELKARHPHLLVDGKEANYAFYTNWKASDEILDWLGKLPPNTYLVSHIVDKTYEQGIGSLNMYSGLRFTFDDVGDALLFKMTFA